jgi:hypothetical protein
MPSWVDIANDALVEIGVEEIQSLDEPTEAARAVKRVYERVRDQVLAEHPWNCALTRASLPALSGSPLWGFSRQFQLPTDPYCLRVWSLNSTAARWKVEGRVLVTDEPAPLSILYIRRVTDPEQLSPWCARAISARIAARVAFRIASSTTKASEVKDWAQRELRAARSIDAQEGTPDEIDVDGFLNERF